MCRKNSNIRIFFFTKTGNWNQIKYDKEVEEKKAGGMNNGE